MVSLLFTRNRCAEMEKNENKLPDLMQVSEDGRSVSAMVGQACSAQEGASCPPEHVYVTSKHRASIAGDLELGQSEMDASRGILSQASSFNADADDEKSVSSLDMDVLGLDDSSGLPGEDDSGSREQQTLLNREPEDDMPNTGGNTRGRRRSRREQHPKNENDCCNQNFRFVRGFLFLAVYSFLLFQPSSAPPGELNENLILQSALQNNDSESLSSLEAHSSIAADNNEPAFPRFISYQNRNEHRRATASNAMPAASAESSKRQPADSNGQQKHLLYSAHSFRKHQEPLVYRKAQKQQSAGRGWYTSGDDEFFSFSFGSPSSSTSTEWYYTIQLVWFGLMILILDTCYREWQHYRVYWRFRLSSAASSRQRRYRTSPSPVPPRRPPRQRRSHTNTF